MTKGDPCADRRISERCDSEHPMSVRVLSWVLDNSEAPGNDRLVLIAIADEADDDGSNAYPSIERIARRARVNKRTTMRSIERLEALGELVVVRPETNGRGHHNRYAVVMGRDVDEVLELAGCQSVTFSGDENGREKRRVKARKGAPMSAPDPLTHRPTSDEEPSSDADASISFSEHARHLCEVLADLVEANGSKRPTVTVTWLREAERMLSIDKRDPVKAERLLRWCQADDFWRSNVLSMPKFRAKFDQLRLRANATARQQARPAGFVSDPEQEQRERAQPTRRATKDEIFGGVRR